MKDSLKVKATQYPSVMVARIICVVENLATDDVDLDTVNTQLIFLPGMSNQMLCINVTTFTDGIYEGPEARGVSLINTKVELNPEKSILEIVDVDG